jgi:hypothetical protein
MTSSVDQADSWIQQGPDGKPYQVRKKAPLTLPSWKAIFKEAFLDLRYGTSPYWKEIKKGSAARRASEACPDHSVYC